MEEKEREQRETTEFQSMHEVTRNKNIEEDHQMRSHLEEKMAHLQQELEMQWQAYTSATERNTADFKSHQMRDKHCTKQVEKQKKQKMRMEDNIKYLKHKMQQRHQECAERNKQLRAEKEKIAGHFQDLKAKMNRRRDAEKKQLADLSMFARDCKQSLQEKVTLGERILRTAAQARKLETEQEKVLPFYISKDADAILNEPDVMAELQAEDHE